MRKYINLFLLIFSISFFSCQKFLEPQLENSLTEAQLLKDPLYSEGLLMRPYYALPDDYNFETDIASDDALTNNLASSYRLMATGEWKASNDPLSVWTSSYEMIYYINKFLGIYESVGWAVDIRLANSYFWIDPTGNLLYVNGKPASGTYIGVNDLRNAYYKKRLRGEAFALRAWYKYKLLQYHGGMSTGGTLLGFPIIDKSLSTTENWSLPRNTYAECVASIFADIDTAIANLPNVWGDSATNLPVNTANTYVNSVNLGTNSRRGYYNACLGGARYENRINGRTARALKTRVALLAASPAFSASSGVTWTQAANIAGNLLNELGALYTNTASIYNHTFYKEIRNKEIIWNRAQVSKRTWEQNNFPPSLFGNGLVNPTQNLVDAFPMKNGYPITDALSGYDPAFPYANRDNRFNEYIVYNNSTLKGATINTYIGAAQNGINVQSTSTRTGYYLKKLMSENVNLNPNSLTSTAHTYTLFRMTELLLNYAEAANEAWGPDVDGGGYGTARSKIAELRLRAGIAADPYLASVTTQAGFRDLIRNERRVSLCFEGFRFWDIRRWNDVATMQASVKAANITNTAGVYSYAYSNVEERKYLPDMIYGPIPFNETLKYNLEQNKGW